MNDGQINLLTDRSLSKNFIVYIEKTENIKLDKKSKDYEKYKLEAKLSLFQEKYIKLMIKVLMLNIKLMLIIKQLTV